MKLWLNDILNLIYPSICHVCGNSLVNGERFACGHCLQSLPRTGYHRHKLNPMEERFAGHFPFERATGHFFYSRDSSLSVLIQDMKYRNFPSIGKMLGNLSGKELYTTGFLSDIDYIIPVPMHFLKKAVRGYNQTDYIAKGLGEASQIKVIQALKMVRQRKTQTSLGRVKRMENADNLFKARGKYDLNGKRLLIVDDVCTTGATLGAAAIAILQSWPNAKISLFTIGVTF